MKQIKVLLINPKQTYYKGSDDFSTYVPVGLLSLAATIKNLCKVEIFDCLIDDFKITKKNNVTTQYGCDEFNIERKIIDYNPDIVGISCPFSCQLLNAVKIANISKNVLPNTVVIMGGPSPSVQGDTIIKNYKTVDICVLGEGEITFPEIIKNFNHNFYDNLKYVDGIIYRGKGRVIKNKIREFIKDLDLLPFPEYSLLDMEKYFDNKWLYFNRSPIHKRSISVFTSRGCPYNCIFCSIHLHMGKRYRAHSSHYVIKHLIFLKEKYNVQSIHFEDDNFSFDKKRFEDILDEIINNNLNITWDTPNGIRADTLSYDLLKKMKRSGCKQLNIAVESGNQNVLNNIVKKRLDLNVIIKVSQWCKELNIPLGALYVIGFPGEDKIMMKETVDFALNLYRNYNVLPGLMIATPLIGTELYKICKKNKYFKYQLSALNLSKATQLDGKHIIETEDFNETDIDELAKYYTDKKREIALTKDC